MKCQAIFWIKGALAVGQFIAKAAMEETGIVRFETVYRELEHMFTGRKEKFLAPNRKAVDYFLS